MMRRRVALTVGLLTVVGATVVAQSGALLRLQLSTPGTMQVGHVNLTGTVRAGSFVGNGSGLTNVSAFTLLGNSQSVFGRLSGTFFYPGVNSFPNSANSFTGNGSALTALSASAFGSGNLPDARIGANIALTTGAQTFTNRQIFTNGLVMSLAPSAGHVLTSNASGLASWQPQSYPSSGAAGGDFAGSYPSPLISTNGALLNKVSQFTMTVNGFQIGIDRGLPNARLDILGALRVFDQDFLSRSGTDLNHGLGWYGPGRTVGPFTQDGPVAYGANGGGLGINQGGNRTMIASWNLNGLLLQRPITSPGALVRSSNTGGTWVDLRKSNSWHWNMISTGSSNGEQAGKILFRNAYQSTVPLTIDAQWNVGLSQPFPSARLEV
ncbi:MAG TPA: hypothetical protein PKA27_16715, partial [Fimbriimonadaceae bacterium]|nr:hypothetical protein [Fimbriimonadaceae bacterium]